MQAGDVILIVLHGTESRARGQARIRQVYSIHLVDGHFPVLESRPFDLLAQVTDHQVLAQALLLREARGVDRFENRERLPRVPQLPGEKFRRIIAEAVVIPIVAHRRGQLRVCAQLVFPLLLQRGLQARPARCRGVFIRSPRRQSHRAGNCNQHGKKPIHSSAPFNFEFPSPNPTQTRSNPGEPSSPRPGRFPVHRVALTEQFVERDQTDLLFLSHGLEGQRLAGDDFEPPQPVL